MFSVFEIWALTFEIFHIHSYLIEASPYNLFGIILSNPGKSVGIAEVKSVCTQTLTVSPLSKVVLVPVPLRKHVTYAVFERSTPAELQIALIMGSAILPVPEGQFVNDWVELHGGLAPEQVVFIVVGALGDTTATLAPCLEAFLIEFFVYQALANSSIPRTIKSSRESISAVSINV
jgi:hypothetical protein